MAKINIKGVGAVHDDNKFEFQPKCKKTISCKSYRRRGIGIMTESGNFEFSTPPPKQRGRGICKKKTAHGGLSITQDGAYYFYCKVYKAEGLDYAEVMRKELEEALHELL